MNTAVQIEQKSYEMPRGIRSESVNASRLLITYPDLSRSMPVV